MADRALTLAIIDRPHVPGPGAPGLRAYKEWWHFNIIDDRNGLDLIANLSIAGDLRTAGAGEANLVLLVFEQDQGWSAALDRYDGLAARLAPDNLDIRLGGSALALAGGRFALDLAGRDGSIAARLALEPATEALVVWKNTPLGRGHINWLILPWLVAKGEVRIGDRRYAVEGARAYHDHNWGNWLWGDNFGWEWWFCSAMCEVGGEPLSFVYDRTLDRSGNRAQEHSLMLWREGRLQHYFPGRMLKLTRSGVFRGPVRRLPGVAALIDPAAVGTIPERIDLVAENGSDRIVASYRPETALQIALPRETGFGLATLNETLGWLHLEGRLGGAEVSATRRACFEVAG